MINTIKRWFDNNKNRSLFFQFITILIFIYIGHFFLSNTVTNLEKQKIASGWGFLTKEAGFPIGESVIKYEPSDNYGKALLAGCFNTIKVALIGNFFAVLLGTLIGIARLSRNWLVSRVSLCYIEGFRNIPLLLQLFFWYTLITNSLPIVKNALQPLPNFFLSNRGLVMPLPKPDPAFELVGWGFLLSFILLLIFWKISRGHQDKTGRSLPFFKIGLSIIIIIPILAWIIGGAPTELDIPKQGRFNFSGGYTVSPEFLSLVLGLVLYTSAFIAEVVRAGILSVKKGQTEAAESLGLKPNQVLRLIILPQALRVIVPPLTSQLLNLTKNSSLAVAIGYPDFVSVSNTTLNQTGQAVECIFLIIVLYLSTSFLTSVFMNWYNKNIALVER